MLEDGSCLPNLYARSGEQAAKIISPAWKGFKKPRN
jgi:hypothetical protein